MLKLSKAYRAFGVEINRLSRLLDGKIMAIYNFLLYDLTYY